MSNYAKESGIAITDVRVSHFRSLANINVSLGDLTILIGANNAGKTSFLDALSAAIGAGRRMLGPDDIRLASSEAMPPKDRQIIIDVRVRPIGDDSKITDKFPAGGYWINLWGSSGIAIDETDFVEFMSFRTTLVWSVSKSDYLVERRFLKEWRAFADWIATPTHDRPVAAAQLEPLALYYIDAKRDLEEDLHRQGLFWRRMTDELGLSDTDVSELEEALTQINDQIVGKREILKHLKIHLNDLQAVVSADSARIDIAPVARKLRDLSKGLDVSFSTAGAQPFPLSRHGMGTRSLASLLVFRAFASWRHAQAVKGGDKVHSILTLEEPESHLHPQAQRSLFSHIKAITGQRVVSTHSPYFAGQAQLDERPGKMKKRLEECRAQLTKGKDPIKVRIVLE
jgi:putative ATP-dependent endonuclease of OLD family